MRTIPTRTVTPRPVSPAAAGTAPACVEPLERRAMLSVSVSAVTTVNGVRTITVTGDTLVAGDVINVTQSGGTGDVTVSGTAGDGTPFNVSRLNVGKIVLESRTGTDLVTYNLANSDLNARNLVVEANLGNGNDTFTANINRDITAGDNLTITVQGAAGNDTLRLNADRDNNFNGVFVGTGGSLVVDYFGGADIDNSNQQFQGELDGRLQIRSFLDQLTDAGQEFGFTRVVFDATSGTAAVFDGRMEGGLLDDDLTFLVGDNSGGNVDVNAHVDAGFNLFDDDEVTRTNNVTVSNAEQVTVANAPAFRNRAVTSPVKRGTPTTLSGVITEPDAGDTWFLDVDWGDGTRQTFTFAPGTFVSGETVAAVQHTYSRVGRYTIKVLWRDQTGLTNEDNTLVAKVLPRLPRALR